MRAAPAVSVVCSGGRAWRMLLWLLPALAAAMLVVWVALQTGLPGPVAWALAAAAAVAIAVVAVRFLPSSANLSWDGTQWRCQGVPVHVQVDVDLGPWMLLSLFVAPEDLASTTTRTDAPCPRWVAVSRGDAGTAMHAFRAAVYCRAPNSPTKPP